jgi:hypothetical protein
MVKQARTMKTTAPRVGPEKSLQELFEERDRTPVGSNEEEQAAEKIAEAIFPDSNAS